VREDRRHVQGSRRHHRSQISYSLIVMLKETASAVSFA
jgi:hypothetical protein